MSYQPIENYGIIGNMRTVALVGMTGSIDWYCYPRFDSSSIFGAILDDKKGGDSKSPPALTVSGTSRSIGLPPTSWLRASFCGMESPS
jgi:GH15 family glucan-1,4-alpha-glucosidase